MLNKPDSTTQYQFKVVWKSSPEALEVHHHPCLAEKGDDAVEMCLGVHPEATIVGVLRSYDDVFEPYKPPRLRGISWQKVWRAFIDPVPIPFWTFSAVVLLAAYGITHMFGD